MLPPLTDLLDTRPAHQANRQPLVGSVNIPLEEMRPRLHELPPKDSLIRLFGCERAERFLLKGGRKCERIQTWESGERAPARLWKANEFLEISLPRLTGGTALDLACGSGREALLLASTGYDVVAIDHLPDAIDRGRSLEARYLPGAAIDWRCEVVGSDMNQPEKLDLITMFFFLDRQVLRLTTKWLKPGGHLLIETFTQAHRESTGKPASDDLTLAPGELRSLLPEMEVLTYEEGEHAGRHTARYLARAS